MTKSGKIYKDPDAWAAKLGCTLAIFIVLGALGSLGLLAWLLVEIIQFIGRH